MEKKFYFPPECNQLEGRTVPQIICGSLEGFAYDPNDDNYNYDF